MPFKHTIDLDFRQLHFLLWNAKGVPEPLFILLLSVADMSVIILSILRLF
jgi:hypothetical protein